MSPGRYLMDAPRDPSRPWAPSPFGRLARAHALSVAGDAMFTTAMAGLVFLSVTRLDQARWQVAATLLFTIVPFSLAAPFLAPLIDRARGGRKWMIVATSALRSLACALLAWNHGHQLLLYPQFTVVLVLARGYVLARSALVPATVRGDAELVRANAKLAIISGTVAVAGGALTLAVMGLASLLDTADPGTGATPAGPGIALGLAAAVYAAGAVEAIRLPPAQVAPAPPGEAETEELRGAGIRVAAVALSVVRTIVGFTTFLLAFHFKDLEDSQPWVSRLGLVGVVVLAQAGFLLGSVAATRARRAIGEEQIILVSLVVIGTAGLVTGAVGGVSGALVLAFSVGLASSSAKQSFDAVVQRDAPDANRGRAFARFETRQQLWWVAGALVPVAAPTRPALGSLAVGLAGAGGAVWFVLARRGLAAGARIPARGWRHRFRPDRPLPVEAAVPTPAAGVVALAPEDVTIVEPRAPVAAIRDDEPTREMPVPVDPLAVTRRQPWAVGGADPGADPTLVAGEPHPGDRTAVWRTLPAPEAGEAEAPWRGSFRPGGPTRAAESGRTQPVSPGRPPPAPAPPSSHGGGSRPLTDDEVGAPSDAAWFHRDRAGAGDRGESHPDDTGVASEVWGTVAPPRDGPTRPP